LRDTGLLKSIAGCSGIVVSITVSSGYFTTAQHIPGDLNLQNLYFYAIEAINRRLYICQSTCFWNLRS